mmetsp:Transcript_82307/g.145927  ORF Transcript_82307/g.145927 Transcript_82307/m.145927 type:complete len:354 (+) Transcript_82307:94-1155(+)
MLAALQSFGFGKSEKSKQKAGNQLANPDAKARAKAKAAEERKKLDPKDFIISGKNAEVIIREEGSINGEQFNVEECKDCDIFLFDHLATVFIDVCENCRIFIGPIESSIFIRNCRSCNFITACQQFRCRDCTDCRFGLLSTTEPIIETSTNMQFACFDFFYFSLREQFKKAGLPVVNNKWWQIHDFNKNDGNPNWSLLPQEEVPNLLRTSACTSITAEELAMDRVVPVTLGSRSWPHAETCFVIFLPQSEVLVETFLGKACKTEGWSLCRARATVLCEERLKTLLAWTKERGLEKKCKGQEITGIEVCGAGVSQQVPVVLGEMAGNSKCIRIVPEPVKDAYAKAFFEVWKDEI